MNAYFVLNKINWFKMSVRFESGFGYTSYETLIDIQSVSVFLFEVLHPFCFQIIQPPFYFK